MKVTAPPPPTTYTHRLQRCADSQCKNTQVQNHYCTSLPKNTILSQFHPLLILTTDFPKIYGDVAT